MRENQGVWRRIVRARPGVPQAAIHAMPAIPSPISKLAARSSHGGNWLRLAAGRASLETASAPVGSPSGTNQGP